MLLSVYDRYKKNNEGMATSTNTAQVSQSGATPTPAPQADVSKTPPAQTTEVSEGEGSPSKSLQADFSSRDKLTDYLKSDQQATRRKV